MICLVKKFRYTSLEPLSVNVRKSTTLSLKNLHNLNPNSFLIKNTHKINCIIKPDKVVCQFIL
jgi:hypothetical protein